MKKCSLCESALIPFCEIKAKKYFKCPNCSAILLDSANYLSLELEKERYAKHQNDVTDLGYQQSVLPLVEKITERFTPQQLGLDYGSGKDSAVAKLLRDKKYKLSLYDPFFNPDDQLLKQHYDYVVCCEVVEHFREPKKEFGLLKSLLKPEGVLYCKTALYAETIDFQNWYYKNDSTHLFFYHTKTMEYIRNNFGFFEVVLV